MTDQPTMEAENAIPLDGLAAGVDYLEAIVVFLVAPAMTYASWVRPSAPLSAGAMGRAYAEALSACAGASRRIESTSSHPASRATVSMTIEDERHTAIVQPIRAFGVAVVFERQAPLGLARAHTHKIVRTLEHELPYGDVSGVRVQPPPTVAVIASSPAPSGASPSMAPTVSVPALVPPPREPTIQDAADVEERGPDTTDSRSPDALRFAPPDRTDWTDEPPVSGANPQKPAIVIPVTTDRVDAPRESPTWASEPPEALPEPPPADPSAPASSATTRARALAIVRFVEGATPEPHMAVLRLALRSGLGLDRLRDLGALGEEQLMLLETAAEEMLGLERGQVQRRIEDARRVAEGSDE